MVDALLQRAEVPHAVLVPIRYELVALLNHLLTLKVEWGAQVEIDVVERVDRAYSNGD